MSVICPLPLHVKLEADFALASFWSKIVPISVFPKVKELESDAEFGEKLKEFSASLTNVDGSTIDV
jgi:hypothetical protein